MQEKVKEKKWKNKTNTYLGKFKPTSRELASGAWTTRGHKIRKE